MFCASISMYDNCICVCPKLIHYETCTTRAHHTTTFVCDGTSSTFRVNFKEPVVIEADNDYIASVTLKVTFKTHYAFIVILKK